MEWKQGRSHRTEASVSAQERASRKEQAGQGSWHVHGLLQNQHHPVTPLQLRAWCGLVRCHIVIEMLSELAHGDHAQCDDTSVELRECKVEIRENRQ